LEGLGKGLRWGWGIGWGRGWGWEGIEDFLSKMSFLAVREGMKVWAKTKKLN